MSIFLVEDHIFSNYDFPSQTLHKKFILFSRRETLPLHRPQILAQAQRDQTLCACPSLVVAAGAVTRRDVIIEYLS